MEIKTKQIKFCINFQVKYAKFLPSKCTRLLLLVKPVQRNCLHFFLKLSNTVRYLSVNEPKLPSRNYFIGDVFTLGSERKSEYAKEHSFGTLSKVLTSLLPLTLRRRHISVFRDYLNFSHFLATSCSF